MRITCANCNSNYTLTYEQISRLKYSIFPCKKCNRLIKITACPHCRAYYSITFSTTYQDKYRLTCEKCSKPFIIEFPLIRDAQKTDKQKTKQIAQGNKQKITKDIRIKSNKKYTQGNRSQADWQIKASGSTLESFDLREIFAICFSAFSRPKLIAAFIGSVTILLLLLLYNGIINLIFTSKNVTDNMYLKSFINLFPLVLIFFIYILISALISRITMEKIFFKSTLSLQKAFSFISKSLFPVFISNILLLLIANLILILFGKMPVVGPVFFALLFLPIYLISLSIVLILIIGFWFYPPIIAKNLSGKTGLARNLLQFVKKHNFTLIYIIPIMMIVTALTFSAIYLLHYGSFSISLFLTKNILSDDGIKLFSAIPASFLRISDMTFFGLDTSIFKSLLDNILLSHSIGGFIIGIIFALISIFLFSSFISIAATMSAHIYIMMERGIDVDDRSKTRLLLLLVLILLGIFLFKKIFF